MMFPSPPHPAPLRNPRRLGTDLAWPLLLAAALLHSARAAEPQAAPPQAPASAAAAATSEPGKKLAPSAAGSSRDIEAQLRDAMNSGDPTRKRLNLIIDGKAKAVPAAPAPAAPAVATPVPAQKMEPGLYIRARAATQHAPAPAKAAAAHEIHWSYEGEGGPQAWGQLKPEYRTCGTGKRQSPVHIEESMTLQGPAEPIRFAYQPSNGTVINNGHTIQVDVYGDNFITVRGSNFKLVQFHFHHPAEERINYKSFPMVAHLVHRNLEGQLAVVAVLLEAGEANPLINKVWTYMPLDARDSVRMPDGLLHLGELLPRDQRYYQYLGSLTTPPCTEGVLWLILKQPVTLSREQLRLFGQLYPNNARPVQPVNNRPIRDAALIAVPSGPGQ